jgi:hypothetical protein
MVFKGVSISTRQVDDRVREEVVQWLRERLIYGELFRDIRATSRGFDRENISIWGRAIWEKRERERIVTCNFVFVFHFVYLWVLTNYLPFLYVKMICLSIGYSRKNLGRQWLA